MITEGGIIGKIGLNLAGVGVTLNAIKAAGVNFEKIPCHLSLRAALDSASREEAVEKLTRYGVASACHILIADPTGSEGLECSAKDISKIQMGNAVEKTPRVVTHTNHFIRPHCQGVEDKVYLPDSVPRLTRIRELVAHRGHDLGMEDIADMLKDEEGYPSSICRAASDTYQVATLFSIVMDLVRKQAIVKVGRPAAPQGMIRLQL